MTIDDSSELKENQIMMFWSLSDFHLLVTVAADQGEFQGGTSIPISFSMFFPYQHRNCMRIGVESRRSSSIS